VTSDVPTTPTEGDVVPASDEQRQVLEAHAVRGAHEVLPAATLEAIEKGEREIAEGDPTGLETALAQMPTAEDLKSRPPFILSEVDGLVIGWDTCGECHFHIRTCLCPNGPKQPRYVTEFRKQQQEREANLARIAEERAARKAVVTADPDEVELRVREVTEVRTSSGRKPRSDKGKPRGPRKKDDNATPETVLEAAGDLSAAMKDS
jgi:hypothetical protein